MRHSDIARHAGQIAQTARIFGILDPAKDSGKQRADRRISLFWRQSELAGKTPDIDLRRRVLLLTPAQSTLQEIAKNIHAVILFTEIVKDDVCARITRLSN
jgi:hypothetical protein